MVTTRHSRGLFFVVATLQPALRVIFLVALSCSCRSGLPPHHAKIARAGDPGLDARGRREPFVSECKDEVELTIMSKITPETESNFAEIVVEFCRFLRSEGINSGVNDSVAAVEATAIVGVRDREVLRMALRAVLCSSKDDWDLFDDLFWIFWRDADSVAGRRERERRTKAKKEMPAPASTLSMMESSSGKAAEDEPGKMMMGATRHERLKKADFSEIPQSDLADLERLALD